MKSIPFVDLPAQYAKLKPEMLAKIDEVIQSSSFIQGRYVEKFEKEFAGAHGAEHALGCSNGTAAISILLEAMGIGAGDEVITVTNTFIATAEAICHVGAKPVFTDVDPETHQMDPKSFEKAITPRTRAVIPVHLYGNPADLRPILEIASRRGIRVIEDAAQAHLADYAGRKVGTWAEAATFSFYPGKNLGAYGDAGLIFCKDATLREKMKKLINHGRHGRMEKYRHDVIGYNQRMDELQGAILSVKLKYLSEWTETRRARARFYREKLGAKGFKTMAPTREANPVYHLFVVEASNRDELIIAMEKHGISCQIHYPVPLHLQPAFSHLGYRPGDFPVAEKLASRILSLPLCGELSQADAAIVADRMLELGRP